MVQQHNAFLILAPPPPAATYIIFYLLPFVFQVRKYQGRGKEKKEEITAAVAVIDDEKT